MINPAPFNAEAPPEALDGEITPVELHYVRSNFAVPTHDGTLEIGGAVDNPTTLTLDDLRAMPAVERAVTLECAGNGRFETRPLPAGEPWGDYAVSTARWKGALLSDVLEQARPAADGLEVRFDGADHGPYHLNPVLAETDRVRAAFRALASARPRSRPGGRDPDRLRDERPAAHPRPRSPVPADRAPLVRRRLREMAATDRGPDRAVRGRVPDRPLHLRMGRSRTRTRHPDARPRPDHRPRPRRDDRRRRRTPSAGRHGQAPDRSPTSTSASPATETGTPPRSSPRPGPTTGKNGRSTGSRRASDDTPSAPEQPTRPATPSPTSHRGTGSATETTQSRSPTSMCADSGSALGSSARTSSLSAWARREPSA